MILSTQEVERGVSLSSKPVRYYLKKKLKEIGKCGNKLLFYAARP